MSATETFEIRMRHPARNALDEALLGWIEAHFDDADGRPVLFAGTSEAFCAGLNLEHVAALDRHGMEAFLRRVDRLVARIFEYPAPTVALIEGHAIAGGCLLACACDQRVATDDANIKIGLNEVALGACFPPRILKLVVRRVPTAQRERVLLGAQLHAPAEALALGLVDEVAADAERVARERLAQLASHPPASYAATKRALRGGVLDPSPEDERRFRDEELPIWTSDELRRRVLAALGR